MSDIVKYLKLPFNFEVYKLQKDLSKIKKWKSHFNTNGYEGDWKLIALYAPDGNSENIVALNTCDSVISPTEVLKGCLYFQEVIASFKTKVITARIMKLNVGAKIKPHKDHDLGYENGVFRIHIPIITNSKVDFVLDGVSLEMKEGQCWYTNVNYIHSVANNGTEDRVHLVLDLERNRWSDDLFFSIASKESFESIQEEPQYDRGTLEEIIKSLKEVNAPASRALIKKFEEQLLKL